MQLFFQSSFITILSLDEFLLVKVITSSKWDYKIIALYNPNGFKELLVSMQHLTVPIHHAVKEIQCSNSRWRRGRLNVKLNKNTLTHIRTSSHVLDKDIHCVLFSFNLWANEFPSVYQNYLHYSSIHVLHRKMDRLKDLQLSLFNHYWSVCTYFKP